MELVDTSDLESDAISVPVRIWHWAPISNPLLFFYNNGFFLKLKERGFFMRKHAKQLNSIAEPIKTSREIGRASCRERV